MADMFDALEKQQASASKARTPSAVLRNPTLLTVPATKHFRAADFTNSGRIDDDECVEVLHTLAQDLGFDVPGADQLEALLAKSERERSESMQLKEFVTFVKLVVAFNEGSVDIAPPAVDKPAPAAPEPPFTPITPATPAHAAPPTKPLVTPLAAPSLVAVTPSGETGSLTDGVGKLRVRVVEAEGLPARADGSACEPYATVSVTELTRRRTRRTRTPARGPSASWVHEAFDFDATSIEAQVVVDVYDGVAAGRPAAPLGKALLPLSECRLGVAHTLIKPMIDGGVLVVRILFDLTDLPSAAEEQAAYAA